MATNDEEAVPDVGDIRHQNRHHDAGQRVGKRGPGRPRKAPPNCRYVCWTAKHGHRYQACPRVDGKRVYGKNRPYEEARAEADQMVARAKSSDGVTLITFEKACQGVLDTVKGKEGTWRSYHEHFITLSDFFGADTPLHEVTRQRIQEFIQRRRADRHRGKPISEGRIRKNLVALGRVFRLAILNDHFAPPSPLDRIELPKTMPKESGHYSIEELAEIITAMRQQKWATAERSWRIVAALAFSGLRRAELCRLRREQVDLKAGVLRDLEGKRNICNLPITKPLASVLQTLMEGLGPKDHLVPAGAPRGPQKEGMPARTEQERRESILNGLFRRFRKVLPERLRSRFHPHSMRHTLATLLADGGVPDHVCNALTRHTDPRSSARYKHPSPLLLRNEAARVLDPLLYIVEPKPTFASEEQA
ncbi:MAG: site-specific integrase [Planctomycetes bacterium]|nr:site-specific integrase [Planctomycetota bacterium]